MKFGKPLIGPNILLYGTQIEIVNTAKHVGVLLDTSMKTMERTLIACRSLRASAASVLRCGIHPAIMNPIVCAKIIQQICFAKALYGCELWGPISDTEILMLERAQRYICKTIQGLPKLTRTDMCLSLLGWKSIYSMISEKKLLFLGQICNLPVKAISFRILVRRLITIKQCPNNMKKLGFTYDCVSLIGKYNLREYLDTFIDYGKFPSKQTWKKIVRLQSVNTIIDSGKNDSWKIMIFRLFVKSIQCIVHTLHGL